MSADDLYRKLRLKQIPELVFLYGQETYLIQQAADSIRKAILGDGDDFNDNCFNGKDVTAELILEAAMTYPVFAEKRLVTVKDSHQLSVTELEKLLPYLQDPVRETCLLFMAEKIDSRRKFFQQFKKNGLLIEFKPLTVRQIPSYIRSVLNRADIKISVDALDLFCLMVDGNLHEIHAELDKLLTYVGSATLIDVKDVQTVVSRGRTENIFALGDAVGQGNIAKALTLVVRLGQAGEAPLKILFLLVRHFRQLWKVRELQVQRRPAGEIAKTLRVPPFVIDSLILQAKKFSRRDFVRAHELFLETDLAMKSSGANADALLENLILQLVKRKDK